MLVMASKDIIIYDINVVYCSSMYFICFDL